MFTKRPKDTRRRIFAFVIRYHDENSTFPTVREIQREFKFGSPNAVDRHLKALAEEGSLKRVGRKARSFEIRGRRVGAALRIPLLGTIPAGLPQTAFTDAQESIVVDRSECRISGKHPVFALRVRGPSMTGADIKEGDLAIFEQREAVEGDIVAALVDGDVTLKRLVRVRSELVLRAENPEYPEIAPQTTLEAQGVLVSVQHSVS